jgi:hypothetical protein
MGEIRNHITILVAKNRRLVKTTLEDLGRDGSTILKLYFRNNF